MTKCYVGSLNKVKLAAVKEVLNDYEVIGMNVNSNVGAQPKCDAETILGAKNRALALPDDGLRIGLEAGVQFHDDTLFLVNWGVLIDQGHIYYAGGTRIPLPEFVKEKIFSEGQELATVMEDYLQINDVRSKEGAIGFFTNSLVKRKDIFVHIVKLLYGQYLRREENK
ncbi:MAG: DUF84 family protein [Acholeplasmataceae bacterium]|nr:DUF84 family protein [Acholeplasmataceae bacterium]